MWYNSHIENEVRSIMIQVDNAAFDHVLTVLVDSLECPPQHDYNNKEFVSECPMQANKDFSCELCWRTFMTKKSVGNFNPDGITIENLPSQ